MQRISGTAILHCVLSCSLCALPLELAAQEDGEVVLGLDGGGLHAASGDAFEITVGARLHVDYSRHGGESDTGVDAVDGIEIRRARIELDGTFDRVWGWAAQVDFAGNDVSLKDFALEYAGLERWSVSVGHQKQPYNLELEMSSNDIPFIARSIDNFLIAPFVDRAVGVRAETGGEHWFAAAGLFGEPIDAGGAGQEGWGTSGRFVFAPVIESERVVHLGFRAAYREPDDVALRIRDETTHFSSLSIVDTGPLVGARRVTLLGPEAAYARGRWTVLGEYDNARIDRRGASDLDFSGWHTSVTYTLGGLSRAGVYRIGAGEFKGLVPDRGFAPGTGGRGAWELAARYASLDLNDGATLGGTEKALTLGANWYANANIRMMLSWTRILDTDGATPLRAGAEGIDVLAARVQLAF